jgi:hypothetical protein
MVTLKGSMSTEGETLLFSVLPYRCSIFPPLVTLHRHNWPSFGKFQDTARFLIPCPRHVSSRLSPSGETCKYATAHSTQKKTWRDSLHIDMLLSAVSVLVVAQHEFGTSGGTFELPCICTSDQHTNNMNRGLYMQPQIHTASLQEIVNSNIF